METIDVSTLNDWIFQNKAHVLLDVREPWEFEHCCIKGSVNIPMSEIQGRLSELDPEIDIVVICHHGSRSMQVAYFLLNSGFIIQSPTAALS